MDAVKFLKNEHEKVKKAFARISKGNILPKLVKPKYSDAVRLRMFNALCRDLDVHEKMEQAIWYPALKKELPVNPIIKHLVREEKAAAKTIKAFKSVKTQATWEKKFEKFRDDVTHHARDEETKLFPVAEKLLEKKKLLELGRKLSAYKLKHRKKVK